MSTTLKPAEFGLLVALAGDTTEEQGMWFIRVLNGLRSLHAPGTETGPEITMRRAGGDSRYLEAQWSWQAPEGEEEAQRQAFKALVNAFMEEVTALAGGWMSDPVRFDGDGPLVLEV